MPPKIMFRIFFSRIGDAQNDNDAGLDRVALQALRRHPIDSTHVGDDQAQDDMQLPPFFGSRLADAVSARNAERSLPRARTTNRCRLTVITGGAGFAGAQPACATEEGRF